MAGGGTREKTGGIGRAGDGKDACLAASPPERLVGSSLGAYTLAEFNAKELNARRVATYPTRVQMPWVNQTYRNAIVFE